MLRKFNDEILDTSYDRIIFKTKKADMHLHWDRHGNAIYYLHVRPMTGPEQILILTYRQKDWFIRMNSIEFWSSTSCSYEELEQKYLNLLKQIYNNDFNRGVSYKNEIF
jgi:hypothetical protein